jgi:hypothetical protein
MREGKKRNEGKTEDQKNPPLRARATEGKADITTDLDRQLLDHLVGAAK